MKKIKFKDIEYRKIKNIEDYKKLRENIENCLTDNKKINIDRLLEYRIEIRNAIDETEKYRNESVICFPYLFNCSKCIDRTFGE